MNLKGRNFLTLKDFTPEEITYYKRIMGKVFLFPAYIRFKPPCPCVCVLALLEVIFRVIIQPPCLRRTGDYSCSILSCCNESLIILHIARVKRHCL